MCALTASMLLSRMNELAVLAVMTQIQRPIYWLLTLKPNHLARISLADVHFYL